MDWAAAMQLCENMGKGLVKWDTADKYLDMKHLTSQAGYWTALTNINGNGCNSANVCDNLLVVSLGRDRSKLNFPNNQLASYRFGSRHLVGQLNSTLTSWLTTNQ